MDDSPAPPKSGRSIRSPAQLEVLARARAKARTVIMAKRREREALKNALNLKRNLKNLKRFLKTTQGERS